MLMSKELSIYVHIPFCERKCNYCDFLSFHANKGTMDTYFDALAKEIAANGIRYRDMEVKTIFFGGGTPSFADDGKICGILDAIYENFKVAEGAEISIEVNPASALFSKLSAYRAKGFNRISIGCQSLNDKELKLLGRLHDSKLFYETFDNARRAGFDNINVDVMSALPGQNLETYVETLNKVLDLKPEHISAYSLIVEEGTPFYDMDLDLPDEDTDRAMYHETKRILKERGYHRYEISNYALGAEHECRHNKVYWTRDNYLGVGLGASSMVDNVRWNNTADLEHYVNESFKADSSFDIIRENREELTIQARMEEFMFLGLRLVRGVDTAEFAGQFGRDIEDVYGEVIQKYVEMGLLEYATEQRGDSKATRMLRLTDAGLDVSNTVMADFLLE